MTITKTLLAFAVLITAAFCVDEPPVSKCPGCAKASAAEAEAAELGETFEKPPVEILKNPTAVTAFLLRDVLEEGDALYTTWTSFITNLLAMNEEEAYKEHHHDDDKLRRLCGLLRRDILAYKGDFNVFFEEFSNLNDYHREAAARMRLSDAKAH
jgi:hypothetical protein